MTELASPASGHTNEPVDGEADAAVYGSGEGGVAPIESYAFESSSGTTATIVEDPLVDPEFAPDDVEAEAEPAPDGNGVPDAGDTPGGPGRRIRAWFTDRTTRELVESITTFLAVAGVVVFTFKMLHPAEIFSSAVPTGGDMGAHIWGPAYLRDHLLPHFQLTGYSDSWYQGFPAYRYYMLPPALLIVALNTFLTYGAAFKIVVVLGSLTMPITAWKFGKLARFAYPIPALFAVAAGIFLFDESFKIQGGNLASTMAGEFSFSLALSLSLLAFGYFAAGMETGKYRIRAVVLIALAMLCHGIVLIFVAVGVVILFLCWIGSERYPAAWPMPLVALGLLAVAWIPNDYEWLRFGVAVAIGCFVLLLVFGFATIDTKRYLWGVPVMVVSGMLIMFWFGPFIGTSNFLTDMKYEPAPGVPDWDSWWKMYFPHTTLTDRFWMALAIVGVVGAIARRHRNGIFLTTYCIFLAAGVKFAHASLPGVGLLWDTRVLPFFYLLRYLLAMLGLFEIVCLVRMPWNHYLVHRAASVSGFHPLAGVYGEQVSRPAWERRSSKMMVITLVGTTLLSISWLAWHLGRFPLEKETYSAKAGWQLEFPQWGDDSGVTLFSTSSKNKGFVSGWTEWNFTGYVGKPAYGEYRALMESMINVGKTQGCGRALFEEPPGDYGTTLAMMPLPFWTDNCIKSSEGLFFESSASTPYTFLTKAAMSQSSSNPVRGLTYENQNAATGVRELQALGVRYYLAYTPEAVARADQQAGLVELTSARSGPWHIYAVVGSDLVVPLKTQPVVVNARSGDQKEKWLEVGASYFQHPEDWAGAPAESGPADWQRVDVAPVSVEAYPKVEQVRSVQSITSKPLPDVTVSQVRQSDESVSFSVDKIGVPIEVKVSYFPNWTVSGADGPYRIAPNMMVVIPRQQNVRLEYKMSKIDKGSYLITLFGLIALYGLWVLNKRQKWPSPATVDAYGWSPHDYPGLALPIAPWGETPTRDERPFDDPDGLPPPLTYAMARPPGDVADGDGDPDSPVANDLEGPWVWAPALPDTSSPSDAASPDGASPAGLRPVAVDVDATPASPWARRAAAQAVYDQDIDEAQRTAVPLAEPQAPAPSPSPAPSPPVQPPVATASSPAAEPPAASATAPAIPLPAASGEQPPPISDRAGDT